MFVQLNIDTSNPTDLIALAALFASLSGPQPVKESFDVPPVALGAVDEVFDNTRIPPAAPQPEPITVRYVAPAPTPAPAPANVDAAGPVTVADALAAIQAAQGRGIGIDKVRELLTKLDVKRVTELSDEKRAEFVTALGAVAS